VRTRVVYSGALLVWAVASFLAAAVNSIGALFGPRLLLGVGEAPFIPAAMRTLSDWLPRSERGMGASVLTSGIALGSAVGPPLLGLLVSGYGWRSCFVATGVLSLLVAVLWYVWYRHPSEDPSSPRRGMSALNARKIVLTTGMVAALAILGTAFSSSATVAIICLSIRGGRRPGPGRRPDLAVRHPLQPRHDEHGSRRIAHSEGELAAATLHGHPLDMSEVLYRVRTGAAPAAVPDTPERHLRLVAQCLVIDVEYAGLHPRRQRQTSVRVAGDYAGGQTVVVVVSDGDGVLDRLKRLHDQDRAEFSSL